MGLPRQLRALLAVPALADSEANRVAATVHQAGLIYGAISLLWTAVWLLVLSGPGPNAAAGLAMAVGVLAPIALARRGRARAAAVALVTAVWVVTTASLVAYGGIGTPAFSTYVIAILIAGLLLGGRAAAATALASAAAGAALAAAEARGLLPEPVFRVSLLATWWVEAILFAAAGGTLWIALAHQRASQRALAQSEGRLRLAAEAARLRVWEIDLASGRVVSSGHALPGLPAADEAPLRDLLERVHPEDAPRLEEACRALSERGAPIEDEARVDGSDDRWHWVAIRAGVERDAADQPSRAVFAVQDVTERKEAEALGERLRQALDQSSEAVLLLDADMVTLYANPAFESILGVRAESLRGAPLESLALGERRRALLSSVRQSLREGRPWRERYEIATSEGEQAVRDGSFTPVRDARDRVVGYVVLVRDVTREVRLEEDLHRAQKLEAVGQLAGGVAHDFNNLLTVILGYLDVLQLEAGEDARLRDPIQQIREASERAADLTRQLLAFGRRQVARPRVVDLGALVDDMQPLLRRLLPESVEIRWKRPEKALPVEADPGQIQQVLLNLAANARDAMPEGGRLEVGVAGETIRDAEDATGVLLAPGAYVRLEVRDTGVGMDAVTRERAFEPFFTTKEVGHGTGLGLASAYGIVDQLGGAIALESAPGTGTTVRIHLPRVEATPTPPPKRSVGEPARGTVLVAEDDAAVRRLVCATLRREGLAVLEARDGAEALERAEEREEPVDLLVTDVVMPRLSGPRLAERLAERWPNLQVLFVSGYPRSELVGGSAAAIDEARVLHKPFPPETVLQHVRAALAEAQSARAGAAGPGRDRAPEGGQEEP